MADDHDRIGRYGGQMLFTAARRRSREAWAMQGSGGCCCALGRLGRLEAVLLLLCHDRGTLRRDCPLPDPGRREPARKAGSGRTW